MSSTAAPADDRPADTERLSIREKFGYGLGDTASNLYWKTFEFFLIFFYTDVFGISAKSAGTMMLVTRATMSGGRVSGMRVPLRAGWRSVVSYSSKMRGGVTLASEPANEPPSTDRITPVSQRACSEAR